MPGLRPYLLAAGTLLLALVVACGGSSDSNSSGDTGSAGGSGSSSAGSSSGNTLQTVNLVESAAKLEELTSFRFDMSIAFDFGDSLTSGDESADAFGAALLALLGNIEAEGAFVAPDQVEMNATFAGQDFGFVQIGDQAWENSGAGWEAVEADASMFSVGDSPTAMFGDFTDMLPQEALDVAETSREEVHGMQTTRYSFDKDSLIQLAEATGEDTTGFTDVDKAELSVWLTDDGIPARILMDFAGKDETGAEVSLKLEMTVWDINSDSVEINPPD